MIVSGYYYWAMPLHAAAATAAARIPLSKIVVLIKGLQATTSCQFAQLSVASPFARFGGQLKDDCILLAIFKIVPLVINRNQCIQFLEFIFALKG
jgi:hypothetical protein